ncbi:MAG: hypothetical protein Q4G14_04035 [Paracoccus sp. (in: a-proteobacteria)]|nr:hypothetical protein [Paracoccus sp. (in: a-proteobacteria)]MDO5612398.1 hypothetical protein [Paracoccus sp. (in: a-proteobacteria)]
MRIVLFLTTALILSACGVDGAPERPAPGLHLDGEARIGIATGV